MNTTIVNDLSDLESLCPSLNLYLKPFAKVNICVSLPLLKMAGQAISNWEVMEKLRNMCDPHEFTLLRVAKSTREFVRFEGELDNKTLVPTLVSILDGKQIKLSGFQGLLKVTCGESKFQFPSRHDWDSFFRDSKDYDETQPGERPDTIYISNIPCKFFMPKKSSTVNSDMVVQAFIGYGEIRNIDIPMLDPYRTDVQSAIPSNFQTFPFGSKLNFEAYIQFKEYIGFAKCMNALRGRKLVFKESDGKAIAATVKVDFDKTKHLSIKSISHRLQEKRKIEKLEKERERQKKKEKELEERKMLAEKMKELQRKKEQDERRKRREEKRRKKQEEKRAREEAEKLAKKIALEERKLLMAQRKLESIRLLSELFDRVETTVKQAEVERLENEIARRVEKERKMKEEEEKRKREKNLKRKLRMERKEEEIKIRLEQRKREDDFMRDQKRRKNAIKKLNPGKQLMSTVVKSSTSKRS